MCGPLRPGSFCNLPADSCTQVHILAEFVCTHSERIIACPAFANGSLDFSSPVTGTDVADRSCAGCDSAAAAMKVGAK